jgi:glycosyltransferase involved in cell wall biosynthesis
MNICAYGNDSGSKYWRIIDPFTYLRKKGIDARLSPNAISPIEIEWADIIVVQSCTDKEGIALLYQAQQEQGKKIVVECDDFMELNADNPFNHEHDLFDAKRTITRTMEIADLVTTTTEYLADRLRVFSDKVAVLPNYMSEERWVMPRLQNTSKQIRIGWAGSITHVDDMKIIIDPIFKLCKEFKNIQLVIVGDPRVGTLFKGLPVEVMNGVPFEAWPSKLASLRLDIGLAPLRDTPFNRCKSNIKWMEYAIMGIPSVCSPTVYQMETDRFDGVYGQIAENEDQWYRCIKNLIVCSNLREDIAMRARSCVTTAYTLQTNIHKWVKVYNSLTQSTEGTIN